MSKEKDDAEARAKSEAEASEKQAAAERAEKARLAAEAKILVRMQKDGEFLTVHPTCVQGHLEAGWKVAAAE